MAALLVLLMLMGWGADRVLQHAMRTSYEKLELEALHDDVNRLVDALEQQLVKLDEVSTEWASWSEMARFATAGGQAFQDEYLAPASLQTSHLQGMAVLDTAGHTRAIITATDGAHQKLFEQLTRSDNATLQTLQERLTPPKGACGLAQSKEAQLLLCLRPILDSQGKGPSKGSLLTARIYDAKTLEQMSRYTRLPLRTFPAREASPDALELDIETHSALAGPAFLTHTSQQTLGAALALRDVHGKVMNHILLDWPRKVTLRGEEVMVEVRRMILLAMAVLALVVLLLVDYLLVAPLVRLRTQLMEVAGEDSWAARIDEKRSDEIGDVARSANALLDVIEKQVDTLQAISLTDALTGLGNRRAFDEQLLQAMGLARRTARPVALIILDIDQFKQYNDRYGHPEGDHVLQAFAQCMRDAVGRPSDRPYRYGGEEFAVVLEDTDARGAQICAEAILARLRQLQLLHQGNPPLGIVTVSAGVSEFRHGDDSDAFIQRADEALYASKHLGRNRVTVSAPPDNPKA